MTGDRLVTYFNGLDTGIVPWRFEEALPSMPSSHVLELKMEDKIEICKFDR